MDYVKLALELHAKYRGKISMSSKVPVSSDLDLSTAYTPGVAGVCLEIARDVSLGNKYTNRANMVAVVSDGSAVLGLGDIGPNAAMPVMEGKAILFREMAGIDAWPLCISASDPTEIIAFVKNLTPTFGGVLLEDISAPKCFQIEAGLQELGIPVFHDDQHGTAVVVLAALLNAAKLVGKNLSDCKVVFSGAGASAIGTAELLLEFGVTNLVLVDTKGAIFEGRDNLTPVKQQIASKTNKSRLSGSIFDALNDADIFLGLSTSDLLHAEHIRLMAPDPIVLALANPDPEILPEDAFAGGAAVVGTGRSDLPNQINNVLAFPGIFRGALDVGASKINNKMKISAALALSDLVAEVSKEQIIPHSLDPRVVPAIAAAVAGSWDD